MPMFLIEAHFEQMTKIKAREALFLASAVSLGAGSMKKEEARALQRRWARMAGFNKSEKARSKAEMATVLGAIGIGLRKE